MKQFGCSYIVKNYLKKIFISHNYKNTKCLEQSKCFIFL